jgi:hypothetical protein
MHVHDPVRAPFRPALRTLLFSCALALRAAAQHAPVAATPAAPAAAQIAGPVAQQVADAGSVLSDGALHAALGLGRATLQSLDLPAQAVPGQSVHARLVVAGMDCDLVLLPCSLRAEGFQLLVQGADGVPHAEAPAPPATYRGTIAGLPDSFVAGSLIDGQLHAVIRLDPTRPLWGVQPASSVDAAAPRALHVVYDSADVALPAYTCGTPDAHVAPPPAGAFAAAGPGDVVCEIGCDTDVEFFQKNGSSVTNTMNDVELVLNAVEAIYDADVGILYSITAILVHTAEPDAFGATGSSALLSQFTQNWNTTQSALVRDVAHLFTGKELDGSVIGVAQLGVICNKGAAYGLVQSKYTGNLAFRAALSAHELGHNWNANHCDGEGACSIMCSGLGGCSGNISSFNTSSKNAISNKKDASSCLDDAVPPPPPVLSAVTPGSVQALFAASVTLTGSGFLKATDVTVGGVSVGATTTFLKLSDTQISFDPAPPLALGAAPVVVVGPGGSSAPGTLTFLATDPPKLNAYPFTVTGFTFPWTWGGGAGQLAFLVIGLSPATFTYQGQTILATDLVLSSAPLNAAGIGTLSVVIPASASGLSFHSQAITLDAGTVKSSNIVTTVVVL